MKMLNMEIELDSEEKARQLLLSGQVSLEISPTYLQCTATRKAMNHGEDDDENVDDAGEDEDGGYEDKLKENSQSMLLEPI